MIKTDLEKLTRKEQRSRKYAENYFEEEWELEGLFKIDARILEEVMRDRGRLLDVSMGPGRHVKLFADKNFEVWGNDFNKHMIQEAKKNVKSKNVKYTNHDMRNLESLKNDFFDYVICMGASLGSIYLKKERQKAVNEMARVARKGGLVVLHSHNAFEISDAVDLFSFFRMCRNSLFRKEFEFGDIAYRHGNVLREAYLHLFTQKELHCLMKDAGLKIVRRYYLKGPDQDAFCRGWFKWFKAGGYIFIGKKL